jgi:hypothetical protein
MELSPSWVAASCAAIQDIQSILWNLYVLVLSVVFTAVKNKLIKVSIAF